MLNKEVCFKCNLRTCQRAYYFVTGEEGLPKGFLASFEAGWKHNACYCPYMAGLIRPQELIPSKCPYAVEHLVNA